MTLAVQSNAPVLYGLVLAGGRSTRMGQDKAAMNWHGKEQRYYMADLLSRFCSNVFISCRQEQVSDVASAGYQAIADSIEGAGPLVGIMSAFQAHSQVSWLVVACDLPLVTEHTLQQLISSRHTTGIATTFISPHDGLPEPLITIWEPAAYPLLQQHMASGYKCPRKALIFNKDNVKMLQVHDDNAIMNTNTPHDAEVAKSLLQSRITE